jgi:hypothetical protein
MISVTGGEYCTTEAVAEMKMRAVDALFCTENVMR